MNFYIYKYYQKYNKDGTPVQPEEFIKGEIIGVDDYESLYDCELDRKWIIDDDLYFCEIDETKE